MSIDDDLLAEAPEIARRSLTPVGMRYDGDLPAFDVPVSAPRVTSAQIAAVLDGE